MPFDAPTPAELKAAFPRFADVHDAAVQFRLDRAARQVDASWTTGDFVLARLLLAAHDLTLDGLGSGAEAEMAAAGAGGFRRLRSGSLDLDRGEATAAERDNPYLSTTYGRQYLELLRRNRGGPRITRCGRGPGESPWGC